MAASVLVGRRGEIERLPVLAEDRSGVLVVRGEAGVGKSALLEDLDAHELEPS
jgi:putative ribosome biogenesis GTPase RsgA